jgi:uncharacterized DUF497 family protein
MVWTWDEAKRARTLQERGLDFADAERIFSGRRQATRATHGGSIGERRFITAGFLDDRFVVMVWTPRANARHVISMRHGHAKEQRLWEEEMGRSR